MGEPIVVFPLQRESLQGIPFDTPPPLQAFTNSDALLAVGLALVVTMTVARFMSLMRRKPDPLLNLILSPMGHTRLVEPRIVVDPPQIG